jgi:hypothetical protein
MRARLLSLLFAAPLVALAGSAAADTITIAGPGSPLSTNNWSFSGTVMSGWLAAIQSSANFGPAGVVPTSINVSTLTAGPVTAASLSGVDLFVSPWWSDSESSGSVTEITTWFLSGGSLLLLQDDNTHDAIGAALGIPTVGGAASTAFSGTGPMFNGPFGVSVNPVGSGTTGALSEADVLAKSGTVDGRNNTVSSQVFSAYWQAGQYAPGAGALVIVADVDAFSSFTATYNPLDANGIFALNSTALAFGFGAVPEPTTVSLMGFGLAGIGLGRRLSRSRARAARTE